MSAWEASGNLTHGVMEIVLMDYDNVALNRRSLAVLQAHCRGCMGSLKEFDVRRHENRLDTC